LADIQHSVPPFAGFRFQISEICGVSDHSQKLSHIASHRIISLAELTQILATNWP